MSEKENDRDDAVSRRTIPGPPVDPAPDDVALGRGSPGPPVVPADEVPDADLDDDEERPTNDPAGEKAIPGAHPEDNPDLQGEERFDAG